MTALGAAAAAALLAAAMLLFGWIVHLMALVAGEGFSIASGVARGVSAWGRTLTERRRASSSPASVPGSPAGPEPDVRPVAGSIRVRA